MIKFAIWGHLKDNFIKKFIKILVALFVLLVSLQAGALIFVQFPKVQTWLAHKVTSAVSDRINGRISVGKVYYVFFNKLIVKDISIISTGNSHYLDSLKSVRGYSDTLLAVDKLSVNLHISDFLKGQIKLNKIVITGGEFNLQSEANRKSNIDRIFKLENKKDKDTNSTLPNLLANTVMIKDFRFTMKNHARYRFKGDSTINFADLDVKNININISDVHLKSDTLFACINRIAGEDKSGTAIVNLSGKARICGTEAFVSDFYLQDKYSVIDSKYFFMKYDSPKNLSDFTQKVVLGLNMEDSYLNFQTIGKIAPSLADSRLAFFMDGKIEGPVRDLRSDRLIVTSESGNSFLDFKVRMQGLPEISRTMAVVEVFNSSTTFKDIASIVASINNKPKNRTLASLAPKERFVYRGTLTGLVDDFVIDGRVLSRKGNCDVDLLFRNESYSGSRFHGYVSLDKVDLGYIINKDIIGEVSADTRCNVLFRRGGGMDIDVDTLDVKNLYLKGYNYTGIEGKGVYAQKEFTGTLVSNDPNFKFAFDGRVSLKEHFLNGAEYDFNAVLSYANLYALNLDKNNNVSNLKFNADVKLLNNGQGITSGLANVKGLHINRCKDSYYAKDIILKIDNSLQGHKAEFVSPFANAKFSGPAPVDSFVRKFIGMAVVSKVPNLFEMDMDESFAGENYDFYLQTFRTRDLLNVTLPGFYVEDSTQLSVHIDKNDKLTASLLSGRLAYNNNYLKGIDISVLSDSLQPAYINMFSKEVRIGGLVMDSTSVALKAEDNILDAGFIFRNKSERENSAHINTKVEFTPKKDILINLLEGSDIMLKGDQWKISPSLIACNDSLIKVDNFKIFNKDQNLTLQGNISKYNSDTLHFGLNNFNVEIFNLFLNRSFDLQGYFSGNGVVSDLYKAPKVFFNIDGKDVSVYSNKVGTLKLMSKWNDVDKELNLLIKSSLKNKVTLNSSGFYRPEDRFLSLNASLEDLSVGYFEPFLSDIISRSSGSMSGELKLSGPLDQLTLTGEDCHFNDMKFKLNFTQVPYTVNGPFELNERGIFFKNLPVYDQFGSKGYMSGKFGYNYFRDLHLDAEVKFSNFQCLDTKERDNEYFYGSAFATGTVHLKGPLDNIHIGIDVFSNKNTSIHIPLINSANASQINLLTFVQPKSSMKVDEYDSLQNVNVKSTKRSTQLSVDIDAQVTPDAEIMIEIDKSMGDVIKARGNGVIDLSINPSKDIFDLFGDYHVTQGSYKFVLAGIATRDFMLQPGGTINFNGNITNTKLDLDAVYSTKANINTLIADTNSVATRRTVNCIIGMQGMMMNPELDFTIDIPDLDPTTKMRVESAFNTKGKVQKQFMSLLALGNFLPDDQSGIANNSSIWYSNASEMLSNQISNIFHQLGIPLDLGLDYQPGDKGTSDIFDVAVSTHLFNNRVIINGNIGNDPYATSNKDVIGNIDVEIKLDNSGNVRLDLFSHAEDRYSTYTDAENSQRNGVGIVYQKEFNSFKELLKGKSKAQKAYEKQEREKRKNARKK